jgi:hypothetical protein
MKLLSLTFSTVLRNEPCVMANDAQNQCATRKALAEAYLIKNQYCNPVLFVPIIHNHLMIGVLKPGASS